MDEREDALKRNVWEFIAPYLIERARRNYVQNEEYKEAVKKADLIFQEIDNSLDEEQSEKLEQYFTADNATTAIMEQLVYQQGMKDMLSLFLSFLKGS